MVSVPSVHSTSDMEQTGLQLSLEVYSVIFGLRRAAGRLFHRDGPATAKLRLPIMVWALGTCRKPVEADLRC